MKLHRTSFVLPVLALLANAGTQAAQNGTPGQEVEARFALAAWGEQAKIKNLFGEELGTLADHVVERASGRLAFAIVEHAGTDGGRRRTVVPYTQFTWDKKQQELLLPLNKEQLEGLPEYDAEALQGLGSEDRPADTDEMEGDQPPVRNLLSSSIQGTRLSAGDAPFGSVTALVIEPRKGTVAFALVHSTGARDKEPATVVPWSALAWNERTGFSVPVSAQELESAPKLEAGSLKPLEDKATLRTISELFPPLEVKN